MPTNAPQQPGSVLLVDDEPHITHILARKLRQLGLEVTVARDGEEGFNLALELLPQLVISDLQMPRLNGLEMAVKLAENPATEKTPILMISGRGFLLDDKRTKQTMIVEVLEKPFSVNNVLDIVQRLMNWSDAGEDAA